MRSKRILVIDDQIDIWELTRISLKIAAGWEVLTASSGSAGLAMAEAEQPDAILLDLMMPEMDGMTTFKKLQDNAATRHIPVIIITAQAHVDERQQLEEMGIKAVIAKPFAPMKLAGQVADMLQWSLE